MWADYFEDNSISYAFFSAADAAAAQEQAERQRRRAEGEEEPVATKKGDAEDEESEGELGSEDDEEEANVGSDVDAELEKAQAAADDADLSEAVAKVDLEDGEEEGWSTEGEPRLRRKARARCASDSGRKGARQTRSVDGLPSARRARIGPHPRAERHRARRPLPLVRPALERLCHHA